VLLPFSPIVPGDGTAEPGGKATGD
jgi:hypothetical protein